MDTQLRNIRIGEVLKNYGYITDEQLNKALALQKQNPKKRIADILIEMGVLSEKQKMEALGQRLGLEVVNLDNYVINLSAVGKIPKNMAQKYGLIAIDIKDGKLLVAVNDPIELCLAENDKINVRLNIIIQK